MTTYRVLWEIDIDADTPLEAARKARRIHLNPASTAVVFEIKEGDRFVENVDLDLHHAAV